MSEAGGGGGAGDADAPLGDHGDGGNCVARPAAGRQGDRDPAGRAPARCRGGLGPVWMVAGIPQVPGMREVFVPGDQIMVVFTAERMRQIGFPDSEFLTVSRG